MSPRSSGRRATRTLPFVFAALGLAVALLWWSSRASSPAVADVPPASGARARSAAVEPGAEPLAVPRAPAPAEQARTSAADTEPAAEAEEPAPAARPVRVALLARFVGPDRSELTLERATIELRSEEEPPRSLAVSHASTVYVEELSPLRYVVSVKAPGFEHRPQPIDMTDIRRLENDRGPGGEPAFDERLVLWPEGWVAIAVATPNGGTLTDLAQELGIEPKRVFVDAFEVRTSLELPTDATWTDERAEPAVFRKPPAYQQWELPGSIVGSLQILEPPPFWVGLKVLGVPLAWERVVRDQREVTFFLDAAAFESRFARLSLRVVDDATGAGASDAKVTLRADTSAHRRKEHENAAPDPRDEVRLERVVPGRYELSIERGEALHQERVDLAPAEHRDLGEIELGGGARIEVRILDERGEPALAWLEIGPYRRGARVSELYPPMLHRHSDDAGAGYLPAPTEISIVRATVYEPTRMYPTDQRSANVLLDPHRLPSGPLTLVVHEPSAVELENLNERAAVLEMLDELDLVVERRDVRAGAPIACELVPGTYRARLVDADGESLGETPFELGGAPLHLDVR